MNIKQYVEDHQDLIDFSNALRDRLEDDWDIVVALTGENGVGKTTLGILLGFLTDGNGFDLKKNVAYFPDAKEIINKFNDLEPHSFFDITEAGKSLYKLRWMEKLQVAINQMYITERWQNKATGLEIPRFTDLNDYFRNHRVKVWIQVVDRGFGIAFLRDDVNIFVSDPWYLKQNAKIINEFRIKRKKRLIDITKEEKKFLYKKTSNFFFAFTFPQLPEEIEERYKELRTESREKEKDPEIETRNQAIRKLAEQGITQDSIAKGFGLTQPTINKIIHS